MNDVFKHSHIVPNGNISCELDTVEQNTDISLLIYEGDFEGAGSLFDLGPGILLVCLTCITLSPANGRSCLSRLL